MIFADDKALVSFVKTQKLKDWQTTLFKKHADEIQVHSKGQLFYKIDTLFPNEHPDSKAVRLLSFEPITKGSFRKAVSNIFRIFNYSSYTADVSERTAKYISETQFNNKNFFAYFLELWVSAALEEDPNSLIVTYPDKFIKASKLDKVIRVLSEDVIFYDADTYIFKSELESDVNYSLDAVTCISTVPFYDQRLQAGNMVDVVRTSQRNTYNQKLNKTYTRTVYHAFVQNKFYKIEQILDSPDEFDVTEYAVNNSELPPIIRAGGFKTDNGIYESFLASFVYFGNLALLQHSQHTAVNFTFSFPRMSELQPVCDNPLCKNGYVSCDITDDCPNGQTQCASCSGSGYKAVQSPFKIYVKRYDPQSMDEKASEAFLNTDDVKYYTPDVGILNYSKTEWRDYLKMAETAAFIQQKVYTGQQQSAESKGIDLEEFYTFLIPISKAFYGALAFSLQCVENDINSSPIKISVNNPYSFAMLTEEDAFNALNTILNSNAPSIIKGNQVENFISKFVSESSPVKKAYQVLKRIDLMFLKSDNELITMKSNSIIDTQMWVTHAFAYSVLMKLYEIDKQLFTQDVDEIVNKLQTELQQYKPVASDLKTTLQEQFLNNNGNA